MVVQQIDEMIQSCRIIRCIENIGLDDAIVRIFKRRFVESLLKFQQLRSLIERTFNTADTRAEMLANIFAVTPQPVRCVQFHAPRRAGLI